MLPLIAKFLTAIQREERLRDERELFIIVVLADNNTEIRVQQYKNVVPCNP
jgi:hypothetical protein